MHRMAFDLIDNIIFLVAILWEWTIINYRMCYLSNMGSVVFYIDLNFLQLLSNQNIDQ